MIQVSHHSFKDSKLTSVKELVFVMDDPKNDDEKPSKKSKAKGKDSKPSVSIKNFGAHVDIGNIKQCSHLQPAWRCRIEALSDGNKKITPIRPVVCLTGMLEVDDQIIRLMWGQQWWQGASMLCYPHVYLKLKCLLNGRLPKQTVLLRESVACDNCIEKNLRNVVVYLFYADSA